MMIFDFKANVISMILAVVIDYILGDPTWLPHPIIFIGKLISALEKKARATAKDDKALKVRGGAIVLIVAFVSFIAPFIVLLFISLTNVKWLYILVNTIILWTTLAAKSLKNAAMEVYIPLIEGNLKEARVKLSYIVGRDTENLSEHEIIRATVETVSENTSDGIIAPMFYGLIGGAPSAMLYKGINTMDSMLGYMNEKFKYIGFFPAKTDDVFNYVPARLTGVFMCLCSFVVKGSIIKSFKIMIRDRKNHKSPNCGYPESATAGAMRVQLGGTNSYFGSLMYKPTIGDDIFPLTKEHIKNSCVLMYTTEILFLIASALLIFII